MRPKFHSKLSKSSKAKANVNKITMKNFSVVPSIFDDNVYNVLFHSAIRLSVVLLNVIVLDVVASFKFMFKTFYDILTFVLKSGRPELREPDKNWVNIKTHCTQHSNSQHNNTQLKYTQHSNTHNNKNFDFQHKNTCSECCYGDGNLCRVLQMLIKACIQKKVERLFPVKFKHCGLG
jgi:hypothetical protein